MKILVRIIVITLLLIHVGDAYPSVQKNQVNGKETINDEQVNSLKMRSKRGALQFGAMIWCEVGRNPLDYNSYGCWCGFGGKGQAVDKIDNCCKVHDKCYDAIVDRGVCGWSSKYTVHIIFYWRSGCTGCASRWLNSSCQKALCECDGAAARCFKAHNSEFKNEYKNHNKSSC